VSQVEEPTMSDTIVLRAELSGTGTTEFEEARDAGELADLLDYWLSDLDERVIVTDLEGNVVFQFD
jgi:hypothetical protein